MFTKRNTFINKRILYSTSTKTEKAIKYTSTVILPKTNFPHHLNAKATVERDASIAKECSFSELYHWQRSNVKGKEYTLLDGPPYANGPVHIGHAINKILKDIIIRSQLLQGRRVHFVPGWDCHGLPIELKAASAIDGNRNVLDIRRQARKFVKRTIADQMAAFRSWGVMAGWDSDVYRTYDSTYVTNQLQTWWELYSRGLVYRDLKPVYWSPSSRSALAEAELVYKETHVSNAVILRLRLDDTGTRFDSSIPVYVLIWTTTPWTLPVNEAVCFSLEMQYSLVTFSGLDGLYLVGSSCIESLSAKFQREVTVVKAMESCELSGLRYRHPWRAGELHRLLPSPHVTASGTGLVHTAPAHGHDDFLVGLKHGLSTLSMVDGEGRYTTQAGEALSGLSLDEGSDVVLQRLECDIMHREQYTHSYPYDWRTDKPVIIRASLQWFIDTAQLKQPALECLSEVSGPTDRLRSLLASRPYWCVSRQRAWGVPIPAFYHRTSGRPLLSKAVVDRLCQHYKNGNADAWWSLTNDELFPSKACQELYVTKDDVERGDDIMDIWIDSGLAWTGLEGRIADVCIEGGDQHTGWFQSSLLTSVGVRGVAPTRHILTHGFAVDESGRKMSKSVGNVVDPQKVTQSAGVDALRWWVASHSHHTQVPASDRLLMTSRDEVVRLRGTLRFLLGALRGIEPEDMSRPAVTYLDRYILHMCNNIYRAVMDAYNSHTWNVACNHILNFTSGPVSGLYVHVTKDRLYCDAVSSPRRQSCCSSLATILQTLTTCLAPILPHLAEEVYLHHPVPQGKFWFKECPGMSPAGEDQTALDIVQKALTIKAEVDKQTVKTGTSKLECLLSLSLEDFVCLKPLQAENDSWDSEMTEILQVACVRISETSGATSVVLKETDRVKCPRCRRHTSLQSEHLCNRCQQVLS